MPDTPYPRSGIAITVISPDFDRVHFSLMTAAAALAMNTPVTLFFSMGASCALVNTGCSDDRRPGWHQLSVTSGHGTPSTAVLRDAALTTSGIGDFETLLSAIQSMGGRFLLCETGLKLQNLSAQSLRTDLDVEVTGLVTFLEETRAFDRTMVF